MFFFVSMVKMRNFVGELCLKLYKIFKTTSFGMDC